MSAPICGTGCCGPKPVTIRSLHVGNGGATYRVVVTNEAGSVTSTTAKLTLTRQGKKNIDPANQTAERIAGNVAPRSRRRVMNDRDRDYYGDDDGEQR